MERLEMRNRQIRQHDALQAIGFVSGQTREEESRVSYMAGFVSMKGEYFGQGDLTLYEAEELARLLSPGDFLLIIPAYNVWEVEGSYIPAAKAHACASYLLQGGVSAERSVIKIGLNKSPYERYPVILPWRVGGKIIPSMFRDDFLDFCSNHLAKLLLDETNGRETNSSNAENDLDEELFVEADCCSLSTFGEEDSSTGASTAAHSIA